MFSTLPHRYLAGLITLIQLVIVLYLEFVLHQPAIALLIAIMDLMAYFSGFMQASGAKEAR
ncbi:MAG TPA: hypothetical protein VHL11_17535 [Phototrophicaceae bacterium]|jgi:hypothetical protein|nr:hypothetical protein [Phototrophicaceae bacterium]